MSSILGGACVPNILVAKQWETRTKNEERETFYNPIPFSKREKSGEREGIILPILWYGNERLLIFKLELRLIFPCASFWPLPPHQQQVGGLWAIRVIPPRLPATEPEWIKRPRE